MSFLGLKPRAAGWKAQTNPLSYCDTLQYIFINWAIPGLSFFWIFLQQIFCIND